MLDTVYTYIEVKQKFLNLVDVIKNLELIGHNVTIGDSSLTVRVAKLK